MNFLITLSSHEIKSRDQTAQHQNILTSTMSLYPANHSPAMQPHVSYHHPRNLQYSTQPRLRALNRTSTYDCHRPLHPHNYRCALHHTAVCKLRSREPLTLNACIIKPSSWLLQLDLRDGRIRQSARCNRPTFPCPPPKEGTCKSDFSQSHPTPP
jgi:hypothetical protein